METNVHAHIDTAISDMTSIYTRMDDRRELAAKQMAAQEIQFDLSNDIKNFRNKLGLDDVINAFQNTDPELYKYIRRLELINTNIWCNQCQNAKTYHDSNVSVDQPKTVQNDITELARISTSLNKLSKRQKKQEKRIMILEGATNKSKSSLATSSFVSRTKKTLSSSDLLM